MDLADDAADVGDAYVTLCVHAGIAAADVLCCRTLGEHAQGDNHVAAVDLLRRATGRQAPELATSLDRLLALKTRAGYGALPMSSDDRLRAWRHAEQLVAAAERT